MFKKLKLAVKALLLKAINRILVDDLYMAYNGDSFYFVLWDLDQELRNHLKYNPDELSSKQLDALNKMSDKLCDLMKKWGVDFIHVE